MKRKLVLDIWVYVLIIGVLLTVYTLRDVWNGRSLQMVWVWLGAGVVGTVVGGIGMSRQMRKKLDAN